MTVTASRHGNVIAAVLVLKCSPITTAQLCLTSASVYERTQQRTSASLVSLDPILSFLSPVLNLPLESSIARDDEKLQSRWERAVKCQERERRRRRREVGWKIGGLEEKVSMCVCVCVCVKSGWHLSWDQIGVLERSPFASGSLSAHL